MVPLSVMEKNPVCKRFLCAATHHKKSIVRINENERAILHILKVIETCTHSLVPNVLISTFQ